jgi:hypothetical protein
MTDGFYVLVQLDGCYHDASVLQLGRRLRRHRSRRPVIFREEIT